MSIKLIDENGNDTGMMVDLPYFHDFYAIVIISDQILNGLPGSYTILFLENLKKERLEIVCFSICAIQKGKQHVKSEWV